MNRRLFYYTVAFALALPWALSVSVLLRAEPEPISTPSAARGTVYHDANANGQLDEGEKGIAGVCVSNGLIVVKTDDAGNYELPVEEDTIVFVVKPRDWMTAIDQNFVPRFYYIYKPAGSPDDAFQYPGVEPTGPLPDRIDFPLRRALESETFVVLMMGDPQPKTMEEVRFYAADVLAELDCCLKPRFAISLGDIVDDDLSLFEPINEAQAVLGMPWYAVHGNHDMNYDATADQHADETFERLYGPANYAFQYGSVHFIVLDNVFWKGYLGKDGIGRTVTGNYEGRLTDPQLEFVANYLQHVPTKDRVVVCTHIPLRNNEPDGKHSTPQLTKLMKVLSSHPHTMSFSGHTHMTQQFFFGPEDGYTPAAPPESLIYGADNDEQIVHHHHNLATASGSWYRGPLDEQGIPQTPMRDGVPNGYTLVTFSGNNYSERFKAARMPADYQMAIHAPAVFDADAPDAPEILVNVFNGNDRTRVRMRISGERDWLLLEQTERIDPAYQAFSEMDQARSDRTGPALPGPFATHHMWAGHLPPELSPGVHMLQVEATDMFGQSDRSQRLIEVR